MQSVRAITRRTCRVVDISGQTCPAGAPSSVCPSPSLSLVVHWGSTSACRVDGEEGEKSPPLWRGGAESSAAIANRGWVDCWAFVMAPVQCRLSVNARESRLRGSPGEAARVRRARRMGWASSRVGTGGACVAAVASGSSLCGRVGAREARGGASGRRSGASEAKSAAKGPATLDFLLTPHQLTHRPVQSLGRVTLAASNERDRPSSAPSPASFPHQCRLDSPHLIPHHTLSALEAVASRVLKVVWLRCARLHCRPDHVRMARAGCGFERM